MKLTDLTAMFHKVGVYVPSTYGLSQQYYTGEHVKAIEDTLIRLFGGSTTIGARGAYDAVHTVVREDVTIVYAFFPVLTDEIDEALYSIAFSLCRSLKQESVAVELDGKLYLVSAE